MQPVNLNNISTDKIPVEVLPKKNIEVSVLRLDKIHPYVSGNKWFKLRYYLEEAKKENKKHIITFGGAWSNHILATAAACSIENFTCTGIIRGEAGKRLSDTLVQAEKMGMKLIFTDRENYRLKKIPAEIADKDYYLINEGGYGLKGAEGAATITAYFQKEKFTHICCAVGTGTMMAGLIWSSAPENKIIGVSVLKNNFDLELNIKRLIAKEQNNFQLIHDYHFGGYAKKNPELIEFMNTFYQQTGIPSDFVYTGKLFFGIYNLIEQDFFPVASKLLVIHSGGLQGNNSLEKGTLIF